MIRRRQEIDVASSLNATIGGLVAITAGCHAVGAPAALLIGGVGGVLAARGNDWLARFKIDDAVGAVPAHLFAGIWGTFAVVIFGDPEILGSDLGVFEQLGVQALGVVVAGLSTIAIVFPIVWGLHRAVGLRVSARAETIGLNIAEHGASTSLQLLMADMDANARSGEFLMRAAVEEGDEAALLASKYNRLLERVRSEVSRRESAIRDLESAKKSAEQAALAKSNFLAHMSHELRTPLHAIIGFADLLAAGVDDDNTRRDEYAGAIGESGRHLLRVINDILEYSRVERDRIELRETLFSLSDVLRSVMRMLGPLAEERSVKLDLKINTEEDAIQADEKLIKQALINVASNAVKFAEDGGSVDIEAHMEPDGRLAIAVIDDGPGIPADQIEIAMQPFRQTADAYTRGAAHQGTGLGLPLAQSFVKLHGGTLTLSAAQPHGLVVTMRLPASRIGAEIRRGA
ncbi:MAG: ATP-binding protein [Pseudomonadota bacterium]